MKEENVTELVGACYEAKRVVELMPRLPQGIKPSHIHVVDVIHQLQEKGGPVRVGDIAAAMHVTSPGVTRLVNELVGLGAVAKAQSREDKRVFTVSLTELGRRYQKDYLERYHRELAERLSDVSDDDVRTMARVIHDAFVAMSAESPRAR
jgi:DNA-binding MarR family transcriptional regulator